MGSAISVVAGCCGRRGYSLQANAKPSRAPSTPDRDAQFAYLDDRARSIWRPGSR